MFTLIAVGVGAAYVFSAVAVMAAGIFPESFRHALGVPIAAGVLYPLFGILLTR